MNLERALRVLKKGGIVVYPTETLYALGALATNRAGIVRIYQIKKRPRGMPLPVICGNLRQAQKFFYFSKREYILAQAFWPGPLSIILRVKDLRVRKALRTLRVAVRVSPNRVAQKLATAVITPLISTSANISGEPGCFTIGCAKRQFRSQPIQPDLYLDGGRLKRGLPSTIIAFKKRRLVIIRKGKISMITLKRFRKKKLFQ